jgi:transcriptional regulator with XRE-family HTH domain
MPSELDKFGAKIRSLRMAKGWSQEELANNAGLDRTYIGGIERGERNVSLKNICLLAKTLGVSIKNLFDWEGSR